VLLTGIKHTFNLANINCASSLLTLSGDFIDCKGL